METAILVLVILILLALAVLLYRAFTVKPDAGLERLKEAFEEELEKELKELREEQERDQAALREAETRAQAAFREAQERDQTALREELNRTLESFSRLNQNTVLQLGQTLTQQQQAAAAAQQERLRETGDALRAQQETSAEALHRQLQQMETRLRSLEAGNEAKLSEIRASLTASLDRQREENSKKLDEIRGTVDERLQTTLEQRITESFRSVSQQLEQVYKGLGEMQALAGDVGGLKKVLSGVKTRGILGEVQLGNILQEILAPEQYDTNVATVPGSANRVEFAVRLPGEGGEGVIYLPIDSKFPGDRYAQLLDAQESGDRAAVTLAWKNLETVLRSEARDIREKYVSEPYTTGFGVMFLPFEGLYAEAVNRGMVETLQREYRVSIAGPSTMAALLNSLQMGFRTLAIQKRSSEVWKVLGEVKTEFDKFEESLTKMQKHLEQTSSDLNALMTTRTRAIQRKLTKVQGLEELND